MKLQKLLASTFALPAAFCLMAQPLLADAPPVPEIDVRQPFKTSLEDGFSKVSFGTAVIGTSGRVRKFAIKNIGSGDLTDIRVTRGGANPKEFKVIQPAKTSLASGSITTFKVAFKPTGKGTRSAVIHIKSNDADEGSFDVVVTGSGQKP